MKFLISYEAETVAIVCDCIVFMSFSTTKHKGITFMF
jgi:hypothetical protein